MNSKQTIMSLLVIAIVILTPANAMTGEITNEYIIGFYGPPDRVSIQQVEGEIVREFNLINAVVIEMPSQAVNSLANRPEVKYIERNQKVYLLGQSVPWGIDRVFANEDYTFSTWNKSKGEGVAVAVLDTGINEEHEDLPKLSGGINTIDDTHWGQDDHGHGTAVSGVIAALDNNIGVVGVAPKADLYSVKVLNEEGSGYLSSIIEGIEWAVEQGILIINISLGAENDSYSLKEAVDEAYSRGHLLIAAAGNEGNTSVDGNKVVYPARYESVIAVTASNYMDLRAEFSSSGEDVELIAPGEKILSTTPEDSYNFWSGTSFSAPHVAGSAALAWSTDLSLNNNQLRELLQESAEDLGLDKKYQGFGLVRPDNLISKISKTDKAGKLKDSFELVFKVKDLAGQDFVGETKVVVIFKTITGEEEIHELEGIKFSDYEGTISWMVGTEYDNDIVLEELQPKDINEITVKADEAEDTISGFNE